MCRLNITIDQSVHTLAPVFDLIDATTFCIRSIRLAPISQTRRAEVYLSLAGGSNGELEALLRKVRALPAVETIGHVNPAFWGLGNGEVREARR